MLTYIYTYIQINMQLILASLFQSRYSLSCGRWISVDMMLRSYSGRVYFSASPRTRSLPISLLWRWPSPALAARTYDIIASDGIKLVWFIFINVVSLLLLLDNVIFAYDDGYTTSSDFRSGCSCQKSLV
jgi:hypothetical protein